MKFLLTCILFLSAQTAAAQDTGETKNQDTPSASPTLAALAREADFIGLVQVQAVDYEKVRSLPSKGYAILNTLVVYRHPGEALQIPRNIQVFAQGFSDDACYYPERWNEGRRFLVFLDKRKKGGFQGARPYCMLPVLVTDRLRYALRYPIPGIRLTDTSVVREFEFRDPDAYVKPGTDITYSQANAFRDQGYLERTADNRHLFTYGIPVDEVRRLMFGEG